VAIVLVGDGDDRLPKWEAPTDSSPRSPAVSAPRAGMAKRASWPRVSSAARRIRAVRSTFTIADVFKMRAARHGPRSRAATVGSGEILTRASGERQLAIRAARVI